MMIMMIMAPYADDGTFIMIVMMIVVMIKIAFVGNDAVRPKIIACIQHPFLTFFLPSRAGNDSLAACATWATER